MRVYNNCRINEQLTAAPVKEPALGKIYTIRQEADIPLDDDAIPLEVEEETEELVSRDDNPNTPPQMSWDYCGKCRIRFGLSEKRDRTGKNHPVCP